MSMSLRELYLAYGAALADDGIPLHFGDLKTEYHAALENAVLLDRSHEGRFTLAGEDRFNLPHRMSTNDMLNMQLGEVRPTIFTNPNARILDRADVFNWQPESILMMTGPGRGSALFDYLRKHIFFNDKVRISDVSATTAQFALHGPQADSIIKAITPNAEAISEAAGFWFSLNEANIFVGRLKPYSGSHWTIIAPIDQAAQVWQALMHAGEPFGLIPAGGLTFNTLRIRAGRAGIGRELSTEYIPLEVGLWDEVSFSKGCYTGQEIIVRMESRNRLARTLVNIVLEAAIDAPAEIYHEGKKVGTLTSSAVSPDGKRFGMGVIKTGLAKKGTRLIISGHAASVGERLGVQPTAILEEED